MITLNWKNQESLNKPAVIDATMSKKAVYIRQNIQEVEVETTDGEKQLKYVYQEAQVAAEDFNLYIESLKASGVDTTPAGLEYQLKLNAPVQYVNGHFYKISYIDNYKAIMDDVNAAINLMEKAGEDISGITNKQITIYDATGLTENAVNMTIAEITTLYFYLYMLKEEYYNEYKVKKALI
ncbi:MAG: hypothetical protein IKT32_01850 [Clostridia bacterium]|nr:hypothetical protein [Clostridia bacterium]